MGARLPIAFLAGFASVITPCVLPLVPGYLSALAGVEPGRLGERGPTRRVVATSVPFILGFTVVFVVLGAGAAAIGNAVSANAQTEVAGVRVRPTPLWMTDEAATEAMVVAALDEAGVADG